MVEPKSLYHCKHCDQNLPFNENKHVPRSCLSYCKGGCRWEYIRPLTEEEIEAYHG